MNRLGRSVFAVFALFLGLFAVLLQARTARADNLYGSIRGTVTDPSGAAAPDVDVTATNIATGASQHVTTSATGAYSFLQLAIGDYDVKATKSGFRPSRRIEFTWT